MALATQCPHCQTTFRVAHDQLKLRAGLVRCGACKQIFNGIENLLRPELQAGATAPATAPASGTDPKTLPSPPATELISSPKVAPSIPSASQTDDRPPSETGAALDSGDQPAEPASPTSAPTSHEVDFYLPEEDSPSEGQPPPDEDAGLQEAAPLAEDKPDPGQEPSKDIPDGPVNADEAPESVVPPPADPMLRMTLLDVRSGNTPTPLEGRPDPLDEVMAELDRKPLRGQPAPPAARKPIVDNEQGTFDGEDEYTDDDYVEDEPNFVLQGRRRDRRNRALRVAMVSGSLLLLLGLLAQGAYVFREQLAVRVPQLKPALLEACAYLDCQVGLPSQIELVSIESNELQTLAPESNTLVLTVLLRNRGSIAQTWPHLELSLNDNGEKTQVRRVFSPAEYLPRDLSPRLGFPGRSEQPVRLYFQLDAVKASGYQVYLFYP